MTSRLVPPIAYQKPETDSPSPEPVFATTKNATANVVLSTLDQTIAPFREAPPPEKGAAGTVSQYLGGALGVMNAPAMFLDTAASVGVSKLLDATGLASLFPPMPVANIGLTMHMGTPHTHAHPPSLIPPAPPIPLPSFGVAFLAGSASVLVNGLPVLRAGDIGIGFTCGSMAPPFEIMTGAAGVYFAGARVARIGADITFHCNPAPATKAFSIGMGVAGAVAGIAGAAGEAAAGNNVAAAVQATQTALDAAALAIGMLRGKDPAGPPGVGMLIGRPTNVLAGGPPIPNVGAWAQGKLFSKIGKLFKSLKNKIRSKSPSADANGQKCQGGEPVHVVTGENYNTHHDFTSFYRGFKWLRHTTSAKASERGTLGFGWSHVFESRLEIRLHRGTFFGFRGERIEFPRIPKERDEVFQSGYVLHRLSDWRFRLSERRLGILEFERETPSAIVARLVSIQNDQARVDLVYNDFGRLTEILEKSSQIDEPLARYSLQYDREHRLLEVNGPINNENLGHPQRLIAYFYDSFGHLSRTEDAQGACEHFKYDIQHRLREAEDRNGYRFQWEYDLESRCIFTSGQDGLWFARFEYLPKELITRMTMHDGSVREYHYDEDGIITKIIDPYGGLLERKKDREGKVVAEIDSGGREVKFLYNSEDAHIARVDRFGHRYLPEIDEPRVPDFFQRQLPENPRDRVFGDTLQALLPSWYFKYFFNTLPLPLAQSAAVVLEINQNSDKTNSPTLQIHDSYGRLLREVDSHEHIQEWQYDNSGNLISHLDRDGSICRNEITSWNLIGARIDPLENKTKYTYNPHEYITSIVDPLGTETKYEYDRKDRLLRVIRDGRIREEYVYDIGDRFIEKLDGEGKTLFKITPHENGLIGKKELASGGFIERDYNSQGKVTKANTDVHKVEIDWDSQRRLRRDSCDGREVWLAYEFDGLARTWINERFVTHHHRDRPGELKIIAPNGFIWRIRTDKQGIVHLSHGNGTEEIQKYDENGKLQGRLVWCYSKNNEIDIWSTKNKYTTEGDLVEVQDSSHGNRRFEVDAAHRLIAEIFEDGTRFEYQLDAAGNLHSKPGLYIVDFAGNKIEFAASNVVETFEYDNRNNISERQRKEKTEKIIRYFHDSIDQLIKIDDGSDEPWTASYDGLGRRVSAGRGEKQTLFWWTDDRLAAETAPDGRLRIYIYTDEKALVPLGFVDYDSSDALPESGRAYTVFTDQIGMPQHIEDSEGRIVWWATRIEPYGKIEIRSDAAIEYNLRWPGHYFDVDTGLNYNRFRYYDPKLGRYLESDPIGCAGGINVYAYPANPLVSVDMLGLSQNHNKHSESSTNSEADQEQPEKLQDLKGWTAEYGEQQKITGDGSVHRDHQPSKAAIKAAIQEDIDRRVSAGEIERPSSEQLKKINKLIDKKATSVIVDKTVHKEGPTYGGKNSSLIESDKNNLGAAAARDADAMVENTRIHDSENLPAINSAAEKIKEQTHESIMEMGRAIVDDVLSEE